MAIPQRQIQGGHVHPLPPYQKSMRIKQLANYIELCAPPLETSWICPSLLTLIARCTPALAASYHYPKVQSVMTNLDEDHLSVKNEMAIFTGQLDTIIHLHN